MNVGGGGGGPVGVRSAILSVALAPIHGVGQQTQQQQQQRQQEEEEEDQPVHLVAALVAQNVPIRRIPHHVAIAVEEVEDEQRSAVVVHRAVGEHRHPLLVVVVVGRATGVLLVLRHNHNHGHEERECQKAGEGHFCVVGCFEEVISERERKYILLICAFME